MTRLNWRDVDSDTLTVDEVATRLYESARTKASSRRLHFDLKYNDVKRLVARGVCQVTGIPFDMRAKVAKGPDFPFRASLDRIDNTVGYVPSNIQVVVKIYNSAKYVWNTEDVLAMAIALMEVAMTDKQKEKLFAEARKAAYESFRYGDQLELPLPIPKRVKSQEKKSDGTR